MRQYVIWLIFLQLCGSEYVDYSDYHPKSVPLQNMPSFQSNNPSPEYKEVMKNLCDNWQSPISYLKKRGYMPSGVEGAPNLHPKKKENLKDNATKGKNYFFFPNKAEDSLRESILALEGDETAGGNTEPPATEVMPEPDDKTNDTAGIINKVKDKFLKIFTHSGHEEDNNKLAKSELLDWDYDIDDPEFLENFNDYEVDRDKRIFVRNAPEKTVKTTIAPSDDLFYNLSDVDIQYVKNFINCFKQNKKDFQIQPLPMAPTNATTTSRPSDSTIVPKVGTNTTADKITADIKIVELVKPNGAKLNETKLNETRPGQNDGKTTDARPNESKPSEGKPSEEKTPGAKPSDEKSTNGKPSEAKPGEPKATEMKPSEAKPNDSKPTDGKLGDQKPSPSDMKSGVISLENTTVCIMECKTPPTTAKSVAINSTTECIPFDGEALSTTKAPPLTMPELTTESSTEASIGTSTRKPESSTSKGSQDDFTVDLDINQKNGTGEEDRLFQMCTCASIISTTCQPPKYPDHTNKYETKTKFLAHLHHRVDEVGKPPYKPLNLTKIQDLIDKSKSSTVIMGDGKTTECAPLRLNDMTFDLEWNKIERTPERARERDKLNILALPYANQPKQSLAAKFLQDVNSYPNNDKDEYLNTPYGDNFLDSQQALPEDLELPLKISTKREAASPSSASRNHKLSKLLSDIASLPEPEGGEDYYSDDDSEESSRRRMKGRLKARGRKKAKHKFKGAGDSASNAVDVDLVSLDSDDLDVGKGNDFTNFEELKDIQFRVNDDDEEAISRFIANLNSPPEVFSFDVDKYLRSAQMDMEPQAPEFEIQSAEPRTFYEFVEAPTIERARLPIIDASGEVEEGPPIEKLPKRPGIKRDLLRQYIKGVSGALSHNYPELNFELSKADEEKPQRSPAFEPDMSFRTNNLIDGFSSNLDAMNYIKSNERDDFLDNFYLLNDGSSQIYDLAKPNQNALPSDRYSPQSLEIDLELDKKFRDLGIGSYNGADRMQQNSVSADAKSGDETAEVNRRIERRNFESTNDY